MIALLLACAPSLAPATQDPGPEAVDPKALAAAVAALAEAFVRGEPADRVAAIEEHGSVVDAKVIEWVARGLRDKAREVQAASIEALRFTEHPHALDALHKTYKSDKKIEKDAVLYAALIRAFAQHGDPESIKLLTSNPLNKGDRNVARARLFGLGRIRHRDAVEGVIGLMRKVGRHRAQRHMEDVRTALIVLTGADHGRSQDAWNDWWNENKRGLEIGPEPHALPKKTQRAWDRYWGKAGDEAAGDEERPERGGGERRRRGGGGGPDDA
ncbi:MAG: hypothetical protein QF903_00715 [Planctomycetota bacterium]|jgi:hypothetical protein|nr:hypothetical protein [Planctomycetota bacterium]